MSKDPLVRLAVTQDMSGWVCALTQFFQPHDVWNLSRVSRCDRDQSESLWQRGLKHNEDKQHLMQTLLNPRRHIIHHLHASAVVLQAIHQMLQSLPVRGNYGDCDVSIGIERDPLTWCHISLQRERPPGSPITLSGSWRGQWSKHIRFFQETKTGPGKYPPYDFGEEVYHIDNKTVMMQQFAHVLLNVLLVFGDDLYFLVRNVDSFCSVVTFWLQLGWNLKLELQIPRVLQSKIMQHPLYQAHWEQIHLHALG